MAYEKPKCDFVASPNHSSRRTGSFIDCLIIHHTGGSRIEGTIATFLKSSSGVSSHYVIGRNGKIVQMVGDADKAWHAGECHLFGQKTDMNSRSIGIELVNKGDRIQTYPAQQIEALAQLSRWLVINYGILSIKVLGHRDVCYPKNRKVDPSDNFPWQIYRWLVWENMDAHRVVCPLPLAPALP